MSSPQCHLTSTLWITPYGLPYGSRCTSAEPFTEEELVEKIRESWNEIEIELIQNSISSWKKRLRDVIKTGGHSTEHLRM